VSEIYGMSEWKAKLIFIAIVKDRNTTNSTVSKITVKKITVSTSLVIEKHKISTLV